MDKYDIVLDLIEHPEKYSQAEATRLLSDSEVHELYDLLCKTESAIKANRKTPMPNVDAEWQAFAAQHLGKSTRFLRFTNRRAASITAGILTSLAAVAICIAVSVSVSNKANNEVEIAEKNPATTEAGINTTATTPVDSTATATSPIQFENAPLSEILEAVANQYNISIQYRNSSAASLRLYYRLDPQLTLDEIIEQLNTFEQLNLHIENHTLIVD
jgi:hypothetical protein